MRRPRRPSLRELGRQEDAILAAVTTCAGDAAARDRFFERAGVYRQYTQIIDHYWRRAGDGVEGREALRRAIFFLWCAATQPCVLTGVVEFSAIREDEIVGYVESLCGDGVLDPQLRWMLAYYHGQYPVVFRRFGDAWALQRLLSDTSAEEWRRVEPTARDFRHRGLMGRFWLQVLAVG